jgi:hypothetical protein
MGSPVTSSSYGGEQRDFVAIRKPVIQVATVSIHEERRAAANGSAGSIHYEQAKFLAIPLGQMVNERAEQRNRYFACFFL